ncbi:MAG: hypothetical protein AAF492_32395, partial [Verrucomicrobiota bacterium]
FSQHSGSENHTAYFEVARGGWVYLAVTQASTRTPAGSIDSPHFLTFEALRKGGWTVIPNLGELRDTNGPWVALFRKCQTGERFAYRTEAATAPILISKP